MDNPNDTKLIPLTYKRQLVGHAIVDAEDYDYLSQWKWHPASRYVIHGKTLMHRLVLERHGVDLTGTYVDHANGDGRDNRLTNLRPATRSQNQANKDGRRNNPFGYKGAIKRGKRWQLTIRCGSKNQYFGCYDNPHIPAQIYNAVASHLYGEYARLNVIPKEHLVDVSTIINIHDVIKYGYTTAMEMARKPIQLPLFAEPKKKKAA